MTDTVQFELDWLQGVTVETVPIKRKGHVILLDSNDSVFKALTLLESNDVLSAPVWDEATKTFIGSMDLHHIVSLIADNFSHEDLFAASAASRLIEKQVLFTKKPVKEIIDFADRNPFHHIRTNDSLLQVISEMCGKQYIRRSLVFKADATEYNQENLVSLLSQTAIIQYISNNKKHLGAAVNLPLELVMKDVDWANSREKIVSIQSTDRVAQAFQLMAAKNVSGLAVLDEHAALIGTLGIRDVRGLMVNDRLDLSRLQQGVREFVNHVRSLSLMERHPAISVKKSDTFGTLISKIASTSVHRIFVIDEHNVPIGVVGPLDVLKALIQQKQ